MPWRSSCRSRNSAPIHVRQSSRVHRTEETIARAVDLLVESGIPVYGVIPERHSLEDLFVRLVNDESLESR
jgi:hypothetical protein